MHGETNANVTEEIASGQVVQDAHITDNDVLFAPASAKEHNY